MQRSDLCTPRSIFFRLPADLSIKEIAAWRSGN
jgi:hypothetical protein